MYLCEQCGKEVYEKFGSGRFCSRSCSNKYVALHQSPEAKVRKVRKGISNLDIRHTCNNPDNRVFVCECEKRYYSGQAYNGHCSKCKIHLGHDPYKYKFTEDDLIKAGKSAAKSKKDKRREWLESVLESGSNAWKGSHSYFRDRLVEFGYKEWKCDCCGNTEWMGQKIPLEVHHVNGGSNKLDNIQFLCPNCHAQTPNYRWRSHNMKKTMGG